jgi:hypothetical protein
MYIKKMIHPIKKKKKISRNFIYSLCNISCFHKRWLLLHTGTTDIVKATEDGQLKNVIYLIETGSSPDQKNATNEKISFSLQ